MFGQTLEIGEDLEFIGETSSHRGMLIIVKKCLRYLFLSVAYCVSLFQLLFLAFVHFVDKEFVLIDRAPSCFG